MEVIIINGFHVSKNRKKKSRIINRFFLLFLVQFEYNWIIGLDVDSGERKKSSKKVDFFAKKSSLYAKNISFILSGRCLIG